MEAKLADAIALAKGSKGLKVQMLVNPRDAEYRSELEAIVGPLPLEVEVWFKLISGGHMGRLSFYDLMASWDLAEYYQEVGTPGLIPLASDGGSLDLCFDVLSRSPDGRKIVLADRAFSPDAGEVRPVATDLCDLLSKGDRVVDFGAPRIKQLR